jgi:hypothetical protein
MRRLASSTGAHRTGLFCCASNLYHSGRSFFRFDTLFASTTLSDDLHKACFFHVLGNLAAELDHAALHLLSGGHFLIGSSEYFPWHPLPHSC